MPDNRTRVKFSFQYSALSSQSFYDLKPFPPGTENDVPYLCSFGGLNFEEIARGVGVSVITVTRDWSFAKSWLLKEMSRE